MLKLILGIVVVGILQLGFVLYSSLQEPVTLALAPVQSESDPAFPEFNLSDAPVSSPDELDEEPSPAPGLTALRRPHAPGPVLRQGRSVKRRLDLSTPERSFQPALPTDFRTVVISYHTAAERTPARRPCDPPEPERAKQRTAFAKAEPAAIRPWQVITTFDPKKD